MLHSSRGHGSAIAREHSLQRLPPEQPSAASLAGRAEAAGEHEVPYRGGRGVTAIGGGLGGCEKRRIDRRNRIASRPHDRLSRSRAAALPHLPLAMSLGPARLLNFLPDRLGRSARKRRLRVRGYWLSFAGEQ